ncbi:MAG: hypothetical protein WB239_16345, partial [Acidimicrobiia bacterium]
MGEHLDPTNRQPGFEDRPPLREAAQHWLDSTSATLLAPVLVSLRSALTDFVEGRYRGAAGALKRLHALRRRYFSDMRPVEDEGS